jgi:hypothetical protein
MQLVGRIEIFINYTFIKIRLSKYLFHNFSVQNGIKQGYALYSISTLLQSILF